MYQKIRCDQSFEFKNQILPAGDYNSTYNISVCIFLQFAYVERVIYSILPTIFLKLLANISSEEMWAQKVSFSQ